ncbi:prepilin-type N-terminal cleavage/methylation domain-containing protein [Bacillus sp. PAMC26568]|nr:prepilin-type N-terminal cleavage/methylation domain-containing protein [Bacillus sp. PAMC26568]
MRIIANQKGVTLIELLLVLALSSMVITLGTSFLITMFKASDRTLADTSLRNESVLVLDALNKTMENADELEIEDNNNTTGLNHIEITEIEMIEDPNNAGSFLEVRVTIPIHVDKGNLYIKNRAVNGEQFSLENTTFYINKNKLICKIIIQDRRSNSEPYEILKIYDLAD